MGCIFWMLRIAGGDEHRSRCESSRTWCFASHWMQFTTMRFAGRGFLCFMPRESAWEGSSMFSSKKAAATMAGASVLGLYHFALADIQNYADSVAGFIPGSGAPAGYDTPASATGFLNGDTSFGGMNPFNPAFLPSDIVVIGSGGELTLHTALPVPTNGFNLGVISNNGITDADPNGTGIAGSPPALFS